jgi:hypothetical protein
MSHVVHKVHNGGLAALAHTFKAMVGKVRVGYIEGKSSPQDDEGGVPVAQVAAWNTYGTLHEDGGWHSPPRPFLREGIDRGRPMFARLNRINLLLCLRGQMTVDQALGQLGAMAAGECKRAIADSRQWAEPNAASTVGRKGSDQPLVDSGNMAQALTFEVGK